MAGGEMQNSFTDVAGDGGFRLPVELGELILSVKGDITAELDGEDAEKHSVASLRWSPLFECGEKLYNNNNRHVYKTILEVSRLYRF